MRVWLAVALAAASLGAAIPHGGVSALVQASVEANNRDWQAAPDYDFIETDRGPHGSRSYRVTMLYGSPYQKLVAVNAEPLPPAQQADEQRKFEEESARRQKESSTQHAARVAEYEKERRRDRVLLQQLGAAFQFKLVGQQRIGGRAVYVLQATPRRGYRPPNRQAEVLTGMRGTVWIDTKTLQWTKVEAQVVHPVTIDGFLATVAPGTRFELEYAPVAGPIWLPTHFVMRARARILFLISRHEQAEEFYSDYHKTAAETSSLRSCFCTGTAPARIQGKGVHREGPGF